jgi:riboflavin kinase/FMN adenylyltransferase
MEILRSLDEAAQQSRHSVVTIGSFDGIHLAHLELLRRVRQYGKQKGAVSTAITFDPHPVQVLAPERAPKLLTPLSVRIELFSRSGIDRLLILPFTLEFSHWSPEQFAAVVLQKTLQARVVIVGDNFRFGHRQAGTPLVMQELGKRDGFETEVVPRMTVRGMTVSSSQIRSLLQQGRLAAANRLLGRCFSIRNHVASGLGIGRTQTVPTLNLAPYDYVIPAAGVYVTQTRVDLRKETGKDTIREAESQSRPFRSVTNVGRRPTFGERELGIETHLLESWHDSSPTEIEVSFLYRLRDERTFSSPPELRAQIMRDVGRTEKYFRRLERFRVAALRD